MHFVFPHSVLVVESSDVTCLLCLEAVCDCMHTGVLTKFGSADGFFQLCFLSLIISVSVEGGAVSCCV